jgi:hypothetical protein
LPAMLIDTVIVGQTHKTMLLKSSEIAEN